MRTKWISVAALSLILLPPGQASKWPRYGGTLRVELHETAVSLDPRQWKAGTSEAAMNAKMVALVYDRLVLLDNYGRFRPQLATEWTHDTAFKRWQFTLRANVKFSDGTALNAPDVATALQPVLPNGLQVSASGTTVVFQSAAPFPDLLEVLASGRCFVYRVQGDGTLLGTGPFFLVDTTTELNKVIHLRFRANEETWSGRPFLDSVDVTLSVPPLRQLFDLQLGKADLVQLSPELVRRATQDNQRVWSSSLVMIYGLRFDGQQPAAANEILREAVALSLDRQTMANVLLQKQAEPASALLPQWLSGYAFLFTMESNIQRAKELRAALPANVAAGSEPLRLRVDAPGDLAKLIGERVAVNARQASILVQVVNRPLARATTSSSDSADGVHLFSWHYSSLSPRVELESMMSGLNLGDTNDPASASAEPEQLYAREKKLLDERRVLPLVAQPEYVGLGQRVRDWMPARWGEWHLADVWLDVPEPTAGQADNAPVLPGGMP